MANHVLPVISDPFIGRETELARINEWLADPACRLLSLVGLGGVGKTRLAVEAANHNAYAFPEGVFFVPLQPLDLPEGILPAIAEKMRIPLSPGIDLKDQLFGHLDHKRKLLVLDGFEHLLSGVAIIVDLLQSAPEVKCLITSREKLNIQEEMVLQLGPLAYPEQEEVTNPEQYPAVELFLNRLHRLDLGLLHLSC